MVGYPSTSLPLGRFPTPQLLRVAAMASVYGLSPDHFRRNFARWVSCYALFKRSSSKSAVLRGGTRLPSAKDASPTHVHTQQPSAVRRGPLRVRSSPRSRRRASIRRIQTTQPLEPILFPKLRICFADFPYLHSPIRLEASDLGALMRL